MFVKSNMTVKEQGSQVAFGSITIDGIFTIDNVRLMKKKDGSCFVSMPRTKDKEGNYSDLVYAIDKESRDDILKAVMEDVAYQNIAKKLYIRSVRVTPVEEGALRGLATVSTDGLTIRNIRIIEGEKGLFVAMPQYQEKDIVYPRNAILRKSLSDAVLREYAKALSREQPENPKPDMPAWKPEETRQKDVHKRENPASTRHLL